jgi:hypothetical protein
MNIFSRNRESAKQSAKRPLSTADLAAASRRAEDLDGNEEPIVNEEPISPAADREAAAERSAATDATDTVDTTAIRDKYARADEAEARATGPGSGSMRQSADRASGDRESGDRQSGDRASGDQASASRWSEPRSSGEWTSGNGTSASRSAGDGTTERAMSSSERTQMEKPRSAEALEPLFSHELAEDYRSRWISIQSGFVDDPRNAVRSGDELVAQMMTNLANSFAEERHRVEAQLDQTGEGSTENLRIALRRYRSFFERLLSL